MTPTPTPHPKYQKILDSLDRQLAALEKAAAEIRLAKASIDSIKEEQEVKIRHRRGRKSMGPAERAEVGERMRNYWQARRQERQ